MSRKVKYFSIAQPLNNEAVANILNHYDLKYGVGKPGLFAYWCLKLIGKKEIIDKALKEIIDKGVVFEKRKPKCAWEMSWPV